MKLEDKFIVWAASIDSSKSRKQGRKLSKKFTVNMPTIQELKQAADSISIKVELALGKSKPRNWWDKSGYLIMEKRGRRLDVLRELAAQIRKARSAALQSERIR